MREKTDTERNELLLIPKIWEAIELKYIECMKCKIKENKKNENKIDKDDREKIKKIKSDEINGYIMYECNQCKNKIKNEEMIYVCQKCDKNSENISVTNVNEDEKEMEFENNDEKIKKLNDIGSQIIMQNMINQPFILCLNCAHKQNHDNVCNYVSNLYTLQLRSIRHYPL